MLASLGMWLFVSTLLFRSSSVSKAVMCYVCIPRHVVVCVRASVLWPNTFILPGETTTYHRPNILWPEIQDAHSADLWWGYFWVTRDLCCHNPVSWLQPVATHSSHTPSDWMGVMCHQGSAPRYLGQVSLALQACVVLVEYNYEDILWGYHGYSLVIANWWQLLGWLKHAWGEVFLSCHDFKFFFFACLEPQS